MDVTVVVVAAAAVVSCDGVVTAVIVGLSGGVFVVASDFESI